LQILVFPVLIVAILGLIIPTAFGEHFENTGFDFEMTHSFSKIEDLKKYILYQNPHEIDFICPSAYDPIFKIFTMKEYEQMIETKSELNINQKLLCTQKYHSGGKLCTDINLEDDFFGKSRTILTSKEFSPDHDEYVGDSTCDLSHTLTRHDDGTVVSPFTSDKIKSLRQECLEQQDSGRNTHLPGSGPAIVRDKNELTNPYSHFNMEYFIFELPKNVKSGYYEIESCSFNLVSISSEPQTENIPDIIIESESSELINESIDEELESSGGGCLIATAAFGSEMASQVQFLREIRDNTVMSTQSGTAFMTGFNQFYYSFSPAIADYERENPVFKEAVKVSLTPLLTSLTLLNYVDIDSEEEMLGYGIGIILLNIGMYFVAPAVLIVSLKKRLFL